MATDDETNEFFDGVRSRAHKIDNRYQPGPNAPHLTVNTLAYGPALSEITNLLGGVHRLSKLCDERGPAGTVTTAEIKRILDDTFLDFASFATPALRQDGGQ